MSSDRQLWFWLFFFFFAMLLLILLRGILLPFVVGMAIAYLLDPVADWLERGGLRRWAATTTVLLFFTLIAMVAVVLIVPLIYTQLMEFIAALPHYIETLRSMVLPTLDRLLDQLSQEQVEGLRAAASERVGQAVSWIGTIFGGLWSGGLVVFNLFSLALITPVVAFYLLRDWDQMVARIDQWLPRRHAHTIRGEIREIDRTLAGFVRGQALVCVILGTFYALALTVLGLNFGLLVGFSAGLLSFIPYVGSAIGFFCSVGIALVQYDTYTMVAVVAAVFFLGQAVEGNFLTPKLVGNRIGLHPVWVIFALLAGGSLFGFVGVLLAVPLAAALGVLVRFGLRQYLGSRYYHGTVAEDGRTPLPGPYRER
jgi:predicted PurR-regulated permease PerM